MAAAEEASAARGALSSTEAALQAEREAAEARAKELEEKHRIAIEAERDSLEIIREAKVSVFFWFSGFVFVFLGWGVEGSRSGFERGVLWELSQRRSVDRFEFRGEKDVWDCSLNLIAAEDGILEGFGATAFTLWRPRCNLEPCCGAMLRNAVY